MNGIEKIAIKGSSGYCCCDEAYNDKITITPSSIAYEYIPQIESEINVHRKWSYKTTSPVFSMIFQQVAKMMPGILEPELVCDCTDVGGIEFVATYTDKTKKSYLYFCPSDEFDECFKLVKQLVPGCEYTPAVLLTSTDYGDDE